MRSRDESSDVDLLTQARAAYAKRSWTEAFSAFAVVDSSGQLGPTDMELFAMTAFMLGRVREMLDIEEHAHHAYLEEGDRLNAARTGLWLAMNLASRGKFPQASGWVEVSERLLESEPDDCVARGYALMPAMLRSAAMGNFDEVADLGGRAADIGRRFNDADLTALAAQTRARALLSMSRTEEGLRLLDEVMISVTGSQLSPMATGLVYCSILEGCYEAHAFTRAAQWTQALTDWCGEQPDLVAFNDQCLAHRSEILRLQGAWTQAATEAKRAGDAGARFQIAAQAHYQLGEIQRMRGEFAAAEATYHKVALDGGEPMPGLALLKLAEGHPEAAHTLLAEALSEATSPFDRIQLLVAFNETSIAVGNLSDAASTASELSEIAESTGTEAHVGWAAQAEGRLALAENRLTQAVVHFKSAKGVWQSLSFPYELARCRVDLSRALKARGDDAGAVRECKAARSTFVELGAMPDTRTIDTLINPPRSEWPAGLTDREVEVLRMVSSGATNRAIAADLVVSERTIDRHVSNIFTKIDVSTRAAATAWAIRNGLA